MKMYTLAFLATSLKFFCSPSYGFNGALFRNVRSLGQVSIFPPITHNTLKEVDISKEKKNNGKHPIRNPLTDLSMSNYAYDDMSKVTSLAVPASSVPVPVPTPVISLASQNLHRPMKVMGT